MLCYECRKKNRCQIFSQLKSISNDFLINDCRKYDDNLKDIYKKIALNDDLMRLIYDYFTENLVGIPENEAKKAIKYNLLDL